VTALPRPPWRGARPLALVYRGKAACDGCPEAVAGLLRGSRWGFEVRYVGRREALPLSPETLRGAALYAQPGGDGTVEAAYRRLRKHAEAIRRFVASGGRYLGFCMGAYLAGATPGFGLLPGDTDQLITSPLADVTSERDTLVEVTWRGRRRSMYFQDGPIFVLDEGAAGVEVLARYRSNQRIAALVAPYGRGRVGVTGPHPEATRSWYEAHALSDPDGLDADLGHDLIDAVMR
jgi:glutamine amidotransferase-like uncharacterized protein